MQRKRRQSVVGRAANVSDVCYVGHTETPGFGVSSKERLMAELALGARSKPTLIQPFDLR